MRPIDLKKDIIMPYFVRGGEGIAEPVKSMPGIYRFSIDNLLKDIEGSPGLRSILLFGIPERKDEEAKEASRDGGIVQKAVRAVKKNFKNLTVITDVCLCAYTTHGHCRLLKRKAKSGKRKTGYKIDDIATLETLARIGVSHARAGADFVAPSAVMDGEVGAIRKALDRAGFKKTRIFAYSAKYASNFYSPFREALDSAPSFGDRTSYQLDFKSQDEALRKISRDIDEGADIVMVKPALGYLDVIYRAKKKFKIPLAAYNVSGEYTMLKSLAAGDKDKERGLVLEALTSIKRAGADLIVSYFGREIASGRFPPPRSLGKPLISTSGVGRAPRNDELFAEAKKYIPGGVNSPVRAFNAVGGHPVFTKKGSGPKIYSESGEEFIDYCLSWGALILGHAHPEITEAIKLAAENGASFGTATEKETRLARLIVETVPSIEKVRLTSSGTEAVMGAVRLARAYTGKDKIIKFEGAYHGHADYLLVKAGSGAATFGIPDSLGVPEDFARHTITLPFNNERLLKDAIEKNREVLAAIIVEPVMANCGVIPAKEGFLERLRKISDKYGVLLIFDEVITGFRVSPGGAQGLFGIKPDLTCLGKIIGGGLPIGAFGGRKEIMALLAPSGGVYQAGTLSGNPVAVTAGIATLDRLKKEDPYEALKSKTEKLCEGIKRRAEKHSVGLKIGCIASLFSIFFEKEDFFAKFFHGLLREGIYFSPSGFEANFLSASHTEEDIEKTLEAVGKTLKEIGG